MPPSRGALRAVTLGLTLLSACAGGRDDQEASGPHLLRAGDTLLEGEVGGSRWEPDADATVPLRLNDVVYRSLPAEPPGRLRFRVTVPKDGRLHFACGLGAGYPPPGVEFAVKVRSWGLETTAWSRLVPPPEGRYGQWTRAEADLGRWAGKTVQLILETRGERAADADRISVAWGTPTLVGPDDGAPLIILYVVDTLRADHTGPYGYGRDTTPVLDELARDGVVFEQMVAQSSWTKPSMASVMTSLLPAHHGAVRRLEYLSTGHVTLAERLEAEGWATGAVMANAVLYARRAGFDQGFEYFAGLHGRAVRRSHRVPAARVVDAALEWLEARRGLPTFLWIHTMDPHTPYSPPPPFDERFVGTPDPSPVPAGLSPERSRERREWIDQYDGEIAYGDQELGRFLRALESRGLYDRATLLFLSDHGEEFLERGGVRHGFTLFEELVRVPLVVKLPGREHAGRRVGVQVQTIDVMPTVLQAAGVTPPGKLAGRALQPLLAGDDAPVPAMVETQHWDATALGVRTETEKYIRHFGPKDLELLFDLEDDPRETTNRADAHPDRVRAWRSEVGPLMRTSPFRTIVRASGSSRYSLRLETSGWLEDVETTGLGDGESSILASSSQVLSLKLEPRADAPREVSFRVRPAGAPVRLTGTRDDRDLEPGDLSWGGDRQADAFPFQLPDPERENPLSRADTLFVPPARDATGLAVWLVETSKDETLALDEDTLDALQAMGYVEP